tara:strand:+ start:6204 stop:6464 length:261 start_codon:yes stop_codon:yes gene_type:complete
MKSGYSCVINACIYAVVLNLIIPPLFVRFLTDEEKKPKGCPSKMSIKSQITHMVYHHSRAPLSTSIIIVIFVSLSMVLGYRFKIIQ